MVDIFNYGEEHAYCGEGPALVMRLARSQLRQFVHALEQEYEAFCHIWEITDTYGEARSNADDIDPTLDDLFGL